MNLEQARFNMIEQQIRPWDVLDGGVNDSLNLDSHGKSLAFVVLDLPVEVPVDLIQLTGGNP